VIEDIEGAESGPSRRAHVRALSVIVIALAFIGYAAMSSATFGGPYATPNPNQRALDMLASPRPTTARSVSSLSSFPFLCAQPQVRTGYGFVNGRPVIIERVAPTPVRCVPDVPVDRSSPLH